MRKITGLAAAFAAGVLLSALPFSCPGVSAAKNNDIQFIKGADVSSLEAVEDYGGKFYDFDGSQKDCLDILKENGVNYLRLRIFNNPTQSFDAGDYCNLEHTVEMAQRIKKAGFGFLLDFHYSDTWADGANQFKPAAWKNMSVQQIGQAVYDYTASVLNALKKADAYPDMVQVGNEIAKGFIWNEGTIDRWDNIALFLNKGIKAVRDTTPAGRSTKVMVHLQCGGSKEDCEEFFTNAQKHGVTDYDIIGLSFYTYWHGSFTDLRENCENLYKKFGKQVVVAETAFPYTYADADGDPNLVGKDLVEATGFEPSVETQRQLLEMTFSTMAGVGGGLGAFYWEPAWLPVEGAGVSKGKGNEWENQIMFDFEGHAMDSLKAFAYSPQSSPVPVRVETPEAVQIAVGSSKIEAAAALPFEVDVLYSNGTLAAQNILWDMSSLPDKLNSYTEYRISGKTDTLNAKIRLLVTEPSALSNSSFEDGDKDWVIDSTAEVAKIGTGSDYTPKKGDYAFHYWDSKNFIADVYQTVTVPSDGRYRVSAWGQGGADSGLKLTLFIKDSGGKVLASSEFTNSGWAVWKNPVIDDVELKAGEQVIIGVHIDGRAGNWGTVDDFEFVNQSTVPSIQEVKEEGTSSDATTGAETGKGAGGGFLPAAAASGAALILAGTLLALYFAKKRRKVGKGG